MSPAFQRHPGVCRFAYSDGRRCRMLVSSSHTCLCTFHALKEREPSPPKELAAAWPDRSLRTSSPPAT